MQYRTESVMQNLLVSSIRTLKNQRLTERDELAFSSGGIYMQIYALDEVLRL